MSTLGCVNVLQIRKQGPPPHPYSAGPHRRLGVGEILINVGKTETNSPAVESAGGTSDEPEPKGGR